MDTTTKQKAIPNSPLMKKTKAELVEIILRKDAVEGELKAKHERAAKDHNFMCRKYSELKDEFDSLQNDYREVCDGRATDYVLANKKERKLKTIITILAIGIIAALLM